MGSYGFSLVYLIWTWSLPCGGIDRHVLLLQILTGRVDNIFPPPGIFLVELPGDQKFASIVIFGELFCVVIHQVLLKTSNLILASQR